MEKNKEYLDGYRNSRLIGGEKLTSKRVLVGIPMTGVIRSEWALARYGQVIPCNWSQTDTIAWMDTYAPLNWLVADARNFIASQAVEKGFEWLFFIDHDVVLPWNTVLKMNDRMHENKVPIWSGLYFTRSVPAEPLIYRGRGNSFYRDWKLGDEVWCDGIPMGCTMISVSILKVLYENSEEYDYRGTKVRRIFKTPAGYHFDPETASIFTETGTEDLYFCDRVMNEDVFRKAGWPEYAEKENPFLVDTSLFCKHIEINGIQYPSRGEESEYLPDDLKARVIVQQK